MTKKNSSPDWFARGVAGLSIILGSIGLYFTNRRTLGTRHRAVARRDPLGNLKE